MLKQVSVISKKFQSPLSNIYYQVLQMEKEEMDYRLGKVLTIIDSTIVNDRQNKGIKDLIKEAFYSSSYHFSGLEEMLRQFRDKFCPNVEKEYEYKLKERDKNIPNDCQNYFPEN